MENFNRFCVCTLITTFTTSLLFPSIAQRVAMAVLQFGALVYAAIFLCIMEIPILRLFVIPKTFLISLQTYHFQNDPVGTTVSSFLDWWYGKSLYQVELELFAKSLVSLNSPLVFFLLFIYACHKKYGPLPILIGFVHILVMFRVLIPLLDLYLES
ncbi:hypothetical protein B0H11DRAFT_454115 [Mycena galericulata]|nr:hypothetical protein B0H11DRAFT_454115 [Mycena galericulata]